MIEIMSMFCNVTGCNVNAVSAICEGGLALCFGALRSRNLRSGNSGLTICM